MDYGDVTANKWHLILPKKNKYTKRDFKYIMEYFKKQNKPISDKIAIYIIVCTAAYHDTSTSKYTYTYNDQKRELKRMFGIDK
jgi:hypothetical protein